MSCPGRGEYELSITKGDKSYAVDFCNSIVSIIP